MKRLDELRQNIDAIDDEILQLLNKRAEYVIEVGKIKQKSNRPLYVPSREKAIYDRLVKKNPGPFPPNALRSVFREIISASLSLEEVQKISYLGPEGTFTHLAGIKHFGLSSKMISARSIPEVFEDVEKKRADYGVIPIENSLEGVVNHTLDMFMDSDLNICGEIFIEVNHNLMNKSGVFEDIKRIYSHPHAIAQCRNWLNNNVPHIQVFEVESTAKAAEMASKDSSAAAIGSEMAEIVYSLKVVHRGIEDFANNFTRFLIIGDVKPEKTGNDKTSLVFSVTHEAGSLYSALKAFADSDINMTKIESRPSKLKTWEYVFYVDIDGHISDPMIKKAIDSFAWHVSFFKILGSYPKGEK
ncbi:MAG: prephenate dehydratase [Flexistipes sinusarabici]|uniref:Bifunctional chorismate mutase/prephenate dehydratase n=1 Tax=Flexistipes sinusarabici TaxID=2352 RepID=A0A5D0MLV7_FLESI|nr:prephenate dehydratase [Flexistipes sinusarabici]TYB32935.1 MAG: prephenate dehydratase [Flexistipes sinusarabici]